MKKSITLPFAIAAGLFIAAGVIAAGTQQASARIPAQDTVPVKSKDFDAILKDLDKAQIELEKMKDMKILVPTIDGEKLKADIDKSMKAIDVEKLNKEISATMAELKQLNSEKMLLEMKAIPTIDGAKMKADLEAAMKNLDAAKMQMELNALAKIDVEKMKLEMEKVKNLDLAKIELQLKEIEPALEKSMEKTKLELAKAKEDITDFKNFTDELSGDGLIEKDGKYTIEHKDGHLIINGQLQPAATYEKYNSYLKKHKKFTIKKDDGLNIFLD